MRTLIIGDIHGCYDELRDLFDAAALASDDIVVSVGDLVDRGPAPAEVVRWFRARPGAVVLMGNHERKHVRGVFSYSQEVTRLQLGAAYADDVAWMRGLPYYYETPDIRVVHAALVPGVPLAEQDEAILAGTTSGEAKLRELVPDGYWHERYTGTPVAFGHHVTGNEPLLRDGVIYGLDTGACHGGRLTALSVPDFRLYSVPARADHWAATARAYQVPVLRTRTWDQMSWRKIDEAIADREGASGDDTTAYLAQLAAWVAAVRALLPRLLAEVPRVAARLRAEHGDDNYAAAAAAHPARPLLFMLDRKRLELDAIAARCTSPAATLALAARLGVATSELPPRP
ncbi:MAG: serine/threonine protein phosphatase [Deltaproteobacteria bacterium]|nr:serine/threonine protein phosphatase [Deltaproteobacteria bacterium]